MIDPEYPRDPQKDGSYGVDADGDNSRMWIQHRLFHECSGHPCPVATDDFFRARPQTMIALRHTLPVLTTELPWSAIETALVAKFTSDDRPAKSEKIGDLLCAGTVEFRAGVSAAGRLRLPLRLMAGLL